MKGDIMNISIIDFSGRNGQGNCWKIAKYIYNKLSFNNHISLIKYSNLNIKGCSKCNYSCLNPNVFKCDNPDETNDVYLQVNQSDIAFYIIPIYSDYPCSNYFIFKERSQATVDLHMKNYNKIKKCFIFIANTGEKNIKNVVEDEPGVNNVALILSTNEFNTKGFYGDLVEKSECLLKIDKYIKSCFENIEKI